MPLCLHHQHPDGHSWPWTVSSTACAPCPSKPCSIKQSTQSFHHEVFKVKYVTHSHTVTEVDAVEDVEIFFQNSFRVRNVSSVTKAPGEEHPLYCFLRLQIACWTMQKKCHAEREELDLYKVILTLHVIYQGWRIWQCTVHQKKAHFKALVVREIFLNGKCKHIMPTP